MTVPHTEGAPWLAREDWASGRIRSSRTSSIALPWIITAGFCGVTLVYLARYELAGDLGRVVTDPSSRIAVPFAATSIVLLIWSIRRTWRWVGGGSSSLQLSTIPGFVGGEVKGSIRLSRSLREGQSVLMTLTCLVVTWRKSADDHIGTSSIQWEDDREIDASAIVRNGDVVPVHFSIPSTSPPTTAHEGDGSDWRAVKWSLTVRTEPGGFDCGRFEVPVFHAPLSMPVGVTGSPSLAEMEAMIASGLKGETFVEHPGKLAERPASTRITTQTTTRGLEIKLPIRMLFVVASLWFILTLPLYFGSLIPALALRMTAGRWLLAAFVLNALPAFVLLVGEPRRIVVNGREIVVHCGWPLLGTRRRFPIEQFDGIDPDPRFFAVLRKNSSFLKRRFFLTMGLSSNAEARWLASEITRAIRKEPVEASKGREDHH